MYCLDPDFRRPFYSYRCLESSLDTRELSGCLSNFFESEKFRGVSEVLRKEVLNAPSGKIARKISKANIKHWRADWQKMRARVFAAGLMMQIMDSKEAWDDAMTTSTNALELSSDKTKLGGLPRSFISNCARQIFASAEDKTVPRLALVTFSRYVSPDIQDQLTKIFAARMPLVATLYAGLDAGVKAEAWCMRHAIPLRYVALASPRIREANAAELLSRSNKVLVLAGPSTRREIRLLVASARTNRIVLHNVTWRGDEAAAQA